MRTERVLHAFKADEGDWRQVEALRHAESTPYVGSAVVAQARNGRVMGKERPNACRRRAGMRVRPHCTSTVGRAAAVPGAAHRARLGILGEQHLDLRAHDAEVVGVGRQFAA
jgi:hypothetical protein